jgi:hypothetical protein
VNKPPDHTLSLLKLTSNPSSTTKKPRLSPIDNSILILLYSVVRSCIPILLTFLNSLFRFSNPPSHEQNLVIQPRGEPHRKHVTCQNAWRGAHRKHLFCCQYACLLTRYPELYIAWTTEKTLLPIPVPLRVRISSVA